MSALSELMSQSIDDANVRYINKNLIKCWEFKKCGKPDCPSYENDNLRCWQSAGTFCGGRVQGAFAQKYGNCKGCNVFITACPTEMDTVGEHFNNMLHLLQEKMNRLDSLNKELILVESLILQATNNNEIRYDNLNLVKCWEINNCHEERCRAHKNDNLRCWQVVGTFSGDEAVGKFAQQCGDCQKCDVYKTACATEVAAIGEQFNNMMFSLQREKAKIAHLNNELFHALDSLERKNSEIMQLTITDTLTGLFNKSQLNERLKTELELAKRYNRLLSLLVMDIDNFKGYNDRFGHQEGDLLLKKIGEIIKGSTRSTDVAFRFGGDEFVVIMPETEQTIAIVIAERIRKAIKDYVFFPVDGSRKSVPVNVTMSIGIASFSQTSDTVEKIISKADHAMYQAKKEARDKVGY